MVKQQVEYKEYISCLITLVDYWRTYLTICKEDSKFLSMLYHFHLLQLLQNELHCCSHLSDQYNSKLVPAFPKHRWQRGKPAVHEKVFLVVLLKDFFLCILKTCIIFDIKKRQKKTKRPHLLCLPDLNMYFCISESSILENDSVLFLTQLSIIKRKE